MDQVCHGLEEFLFVYLDDILIASCDAKQHRRHLRLLFKRLAEHGLVINVAKCKFGVDAIDFLGHQVMKQGVQPLLERVEAIRKIPPPCDAKALNEFLGMVYFYHRFVPHAATLMEPLHSMSHVKGSDFQWTKRQLLMKPNMLWLRRLYSSIPATLPPHASLWMHPIWRLTEFWSSS